MKLFLSDLPLILLYISAMGLGVYRLLRTRSAVMLLMPNLGMVFAFQYRETKSGLASGLVAGIAAGLCLEYLPAAWRYPAAAFCLTFFVGAFIEGVPTLGWLISTAFIGLVMAGVALLVMCLIALAVKASRQNDDQGESDG